MEIIFIKDSDNGYRVIKISGKFVGSNNVIWRFNSRWFYDKYLWTAIRDSEIRHIDIVVSYPLFGKKEKYSSWRTMQFYFKL